MLVWTVQRYDGCMPSSLNRYQAEGHYHFLTFSCYRRLPYLNNDRARIVFEETLEKLRQRHQFLVLGYVLMPEHVHLLLTEPKLHPIATTLSVLKGETSKLLKGERGQFWQVRYYRLQRLHQHEARGEAAIHPPQSRRARSCGEA
jgi:putative transposase